LATKKDMAHHNI